MREYFVYIMTNYPRKTVLYTGVTNNLSCRADQHILSFGESFTKRYNINRVIYTETFSSIHDAIAREKQIKGWSRQKKIDLIQRVNPQYHDWLE